MTNFTPFLAEVADKEPTITAIWTVATFLCVGGFVLCRWRRVAGLILLPLAALWAWAMFSEIIVDYDECFELGKIPKFDVFGKEGQIVSCIGMNPFEK